MVIFAVQVIGRVLLLVNQRLCTRSWRSWRWSVIVNIVSFHIFMAPAGLPLAIVVTVLWIIVAVRNKQHLTGLFVQRSE